MEAHVCLEHELINAAILAHDLPFGLWEHEEPSINYGVHSLYHLRGNALRFLLRGNRRGGCDAADGADKVSERGEDGVVGCEFAVFEVL